MCERGEGKGGGGGSKSGTSSRCRRRRKIWRFTHAGACEASRRAPEDRPGMTTVSSQETEGASGGRSRQSLLLGRGAESIPATCGSARGGRAGCRSAGCLVALFLLSAARVSRVTPGAEGSSGVIDAVFDNHAHIQVLAESQEKFDPEDA